MSEMLLRLRIDSVFVVTGLRIQALHFVNAPDFSFSSGYLGLLSELGCLIGVIFCCVPHLQHLFRQVSEYAPIRRIQNFDWGALLSKGGNFVGHNSDGPSVVVLAAVGTADATASSKDCEPQRSSLKDCTPPARTVPPWKQSFHHEGLYCEPPSSIDNDTY